MKKYRFIVLIFILSSYLFSEEDVTDFYVDTAGILSTGTTIDTNKLLSNYAPKLTLGLDINCMVKGGFTFFLNNILSISKLKNTSYTLADGTLHEGMERTTLFTSEILLGRTFKK